MKINIIGAGISGISAGIYGQLNGFETEIFEYSNKAGGVCSSWENKGYKVNGSLHWLCGSNEGIDFYEMWKELGIFDEPYKVINHNQFIEFKDLEGENIRFYTNVNLLEKELLRVSCEDKKQIDEFISGIRKFSINFPLKKSLEFFTTIEKIKVLFKYFGFIMNMGKFQQITVREFANKFKSEILKKAFLNIWEPEMSLGFLMMQFAYSNMNTAGFLQGGSGEFIKRLRNKYEALGGKINYHKEIVKAEILDKTCTGFYDSMANFYPCDEVISACDLNLTLNKILEGKYTDEKYSNALLNFTPFPPLLYFSAGVKRSFKELNSSSIGLNLPLQKEENFGGVSHDRLTIQIYNFDETLSPEGSTLLTAMISTDYEYWKQLNKNSDVYTDEKNRICTLIVNLLEKYFPSIKNQIEFADLATPITFESYTKNYRASYEGWLPNSITAKNQLPQEIKGLRNFYLIGHWTTPGGGMPPAAFSGKNIIRRICKNNNIPFKE